MSKLEVGQRVRHTDRGACSDGQVGTLLDLPNEHTQLVWVRFDDRSYNNTVATELDARPSCTACFYNDLVPVEG